MSDTFDPYRQWLGIADARRPANHYVLLGVDPGEGDREKIWTQAQCQMGRILEADPALQSADARRIFEELEAARDCLCNPRTRQDYDAQLHERRSADPTPELISPDPVPAVAAVETVRAHDSEPFDAYREWLGISDPQRPPNHYALLGLDLYEDDREKIDDISMLLMARVLEHDPGPHCEMACRIFDELDVARNCLCDSQRKQAYDARLREQRAGKPASGSPQPGDSAGARRKSWGSLAPRGSSVLHADSDERGDSSVVVAASDSSIARRGRTPKPPEPETAPLAQIPWHVQQSRLVGAILGGIFVVAVIAYFIFREPPEHNPVPALMAKLSHADPQRRIEAAQALRKLGPRCSDVLPQLVQVLSSEADEDVRLAIAQAVREAGPGTIVYTRDFEIIKTRELNPGVLQILNELTAK